MKEIIIGYKEHKPGEPDPLWTAWEQTGELIRCKDCKWWTITSPTFPIKGFCGCYHGEHDGDWFCADGVVKDNCSEFPNN